MKALLISSFVFLLVFQAASQVSINTDGNPPDASSVLDIDSDSLGLLIPRLTEQQRDLISTPATGLIIYQTNNPQGFYFFNGTEWVAVGAQILSINDLLDGKASAGNVFLGDGAGSNNTLTTTTRNVGVGENALFSNVVGRYNTAIGYGSLYGNIGWFNTAAGSFALENNVSGWYNAAYGFFALKSNTTGDTNTAVGSFALSSNSTGLHNTAIGAEALHNNTEGNFNTASGAGSLFNNVDGMNNTAVGYNAMGMNSSGDHNTVFGQDADYYNQSGSNNTIIGYSAGKGTSLHNKSGNVYLGYEAGMNDTSDNKLYIANTGTSSPLIYGDFTDEHMAVNGSLEVTNSMRVGIGTPDPSALVEFSASDKGFLPPRLTTAEQSLIEHPAAGLMIFNTDSSDFYAFNGNVWLSFWAFPTDTIDRHCPDSIYYSGQWYATIQTGSQCWMAENLNVGTMIPSNQHSVDNLILEKYCIEDSEDSCLIYGGHYQWNEMMQYTTMEGTRGICPEDWHIPTQSEWAVLSSYAGGDSIAGGKLKEVGFDHWSPPNTGATDQFGFKGLPAGIANPSSGNWNGQSIQGLFWTSTQSPDQAYYRELFYSDDDFDEQIHVKSSGFSVRCIRDWNY